MVTYEMLVEHTKKDKITFVVFEVWEDGAKCVHDIIDLPETWAIRRLRSNLKRILGSVDNFNSVWAARKIVVTA